MAENQGEESKFNMALAYLKRIDIILTHCQNSAIKQDIDSWVNLLRSLYREAIIKLNDDERNEILGINGKVIDINGEITKEQATFKNVNILISNPVNKLMHKGTILFLLDALETKLRDKLYEKGMLLPSKRDPTRAVLRKV